MDESRVDDRRAVELRLRTAADADSVVRPGIRLQRVQHVHDLFGLGDLDEVDVRLEPVRRAEMLADHEMTGGQVQQDAVLERGVRLVVKVDADVVLAEEPLQRLDVRVVHDVEEVVRLLRGGEDALAARRRPTDEQDARAPAPSLQRRVERVRHRKRQRPPHLGVLRGGVRDERIEGDEAVEVAGIHGLELPAAPTRIGIAREEADRRGLEAGEEAGCQDLGPEDQHDVRREALQHLARRGWIVAAVVDEDRLELVERAVERARCEPPRLPNLREAEPLAETRRRVRASAKTPEQAPHGHGAHRHRVHAGAGYARPGMPDWQERVTHETPPHIRFEHVVRYAAAAPLVAAGAPWCDLGCGTGIVADEAFRATPPTRALLVDVDQAVAEEAAGRFPRTDATALALDLSREETFTVLRERLSRWDAPCITCFEVIEHLENFAPLIRFLAERAEAGATVLLSAPNDELTGTRNPFHLSTWGEGSFAELLTLIPEQQRVLEQVALVGSALRARDEPPRDVALDLRIERVKGPSHLLVAFGPRAHEVELPCRIEAVDLDEHRLWERQREADLAYSMVRLEVLERRVADGRAPPAEP